jgi:hypothetical protein
MVSPMQSLDHMATHTIDFDAEIERRVTRHEKQIKGSVVAFSIAVIIALVLWAAFLLYL